MQSACQQHCLSGGNLYARNMPVIIDKGKMRQARAGEKAKYTFLKSTDFFSHITNLIPGIGGVSGARVAIGDKASIQPVTLVGREAALAPAGDLHGDSLAKEFGHTLASLSAKHAGEVL